MNIVLKSVVNFVKDNGFTNASSLSFFFILALAPFLLFLSSMLIFLLSNYVQYYNVLSQKIVLIFPPMFKGIMLDIIKPLVYKKISYFSLFLYAGTSLSYFYMLNASINKIFKINKKRPIVELFFIYIALITIMMLLVIAYLAGFFMPIDVVKDYLISIFKINALFDFFSVYVVPFLSLFVMAFLLYKILPLTKIRLKNAGIGALFFALVVEILKRLFIIYVVSIGRLNIIYGAFWGYVAFLVWIYAFFCTFLIGAYLVYNLENKI
ncbi:YihY/virulence factor BrkB family protein [Desulfurella sp.]|uniref:YihY/virulence factor BrkB family protein n=1 Tax=Desulfurella sp. TaxID=1962857 RepID=UPI003D0E0598